MDCLIIFAKAPVPGRVKTRLSPAFSAQQACAIHWALVRSMLKRMNSLLPAMQLELHSDDCQHPAVVALTQAFPSLVLKNQRGQCLGERMSAAFNGACEHFDRVVLCGSDSLAFTAKHVQHMTQRLDSCDVVFTPVTDGGYIAVGARRSEDVSKLFRNIDWGSSSVMSQTRERAAEHGLTLDELKAVTDIDTPADLETIDLESLLAKQ